MNMRHPHVLQLIMDSLRYWVSEMHVDGFRFDLASALARSLYDVDRLSAFFDLIQQDPVISQVKLIAEPWDVGEGGYQVGNFPPLWSEWNGATATRCATSGGARTPCSASSRPASPAAPTSTRATRAGRPLRINFVTAHDGFTLRDLVSYNEKHNEANGEENKRRREPQPVVELRCRRAQRRSGDQRAARRQQRNFLATLLLSQGVPMLARRRRGRAHAVRQQQRLLPGQRDLLARLGERRRRPGRRSHADSSPSGARTRCSGAAAGSRAAPSAVPSTVTSPGSARMGRR